MPNKSSKGKKKVKTMKDFQDELKKHKCKFSKEIDFIDCELCGGGRVRFCDCGDFIEV